MRAVPLVLACSILGLGCGCPTLEGTRADRKVSGHLTYQLPDTGPTTDDIGGGSFSVGSDVSSVYLDEVDFGLEPGERSQVTNPPPFAARLSVHVPAGGASEIDLSDDNVILTVHLSAMPAPIAYHAVGGHLSIHGIDWTCQFDCLLRASGTLTVSATGPNEEVFELSAGTFVANDTHYDTGMCKPD